MLDFRNSPTRKTQPPPNYLARREQKRLLLMVMSLGLVFLLIGVAAQPEVWERLGFGGGKPGDSAPSGAGANGAGANGAGSNGAGSNGAEPGGASERELAARRFYDTRVRPRSDDALPLDTFIAKADQPAQIDLEAEYFPGVVPEHLAEIRDDRELRSDEHEAWFNLLAVLQAADPEELKRQAEKVGFGKLFLTPDVYRGRLVTVTGRVKRAFDVRSPRNDLGVDTIHQLWLFPDRDPVVLYVLDLPDGFPSSRVPGDPEAVRNINERATVTGFFFKNWAYGTEHNILSAPLVLANEIQWHQREAAGDDDEAAGLPVEWIAAILGGAALFGIVVAMIIFLTTRNPKSPALGGAAARYQDASIGDLSEMDAGTDVGAAIQTMLEDDESASKDGLH